MWQLKKAEKANKLINFIGALGIHQWMAALIIMRYREFRHDSEHRKVMYPDLFEAENIK